MIYDVIILGSGPAGLYFAKACQPYNLKIAMIEKELVGGTGFRTGCLPVKKYLDGIRDLRRIESHQSSDWFTGQVDKSKLYKHLNTSIPEIESFISDKLKSLNVDLFHGDCQFTSSEDQDLKHIELNGQMLSAKTIIIATGTKTLSLGDLKIDEEKILSHKGMVALKELPKSVTIIGGNVEGIEFASYLSAFDVDVNVLTIGDVFLEGTDEDLSRDTLEYLASQGVKLLKQTKVVSHEVKESGVVLHLEEEEESCITSEKVLITGARAGNIPEGLEACGVTVKDTMIQVDEKYETSMNGIYAIGDVNGIHGMAHIATQQGIQLADHLFAGKQSVRDYDSLPRAIFTICEIAGAGLQEGDCERLGLEYSVKTISLESGFRAWSKGEKGGLVKLILNLDEEVIGYWICSENASDYVGTIGLWIDEKITLDQIKNRLMIHPSIGESLLDVVLK